jgi:hypothetical protein
MTQFGQMILWLLIREIVGYVINWIIYVFVLVVNLIAQFTDIVYIKSIEFVQRLAIFLK